VQHAIHTSAMQGQRAVERGERTIVGVNQFTAEEGPPAIFRPDPRARGEVLADLARVRAERDGARVEGALQALRQTARGAGNLVEAILPAVEAYATLGEICAVLEAEFGLYEAPEFRG
jgi:methylmalonyl-CoA mutase N-terminal domain/subunit